MELDIFVSHSGNKDDGWPVMVWFHGGDFNTGTPAIWDASTFVSKHKVSCSTNILDSTKTPKLTIFHSTK